MNSPCSTHRREMRSGFTLIELLVVIAIIAILASILFPVFARARENGRRASCQSNLKQLAISWTMYAQDYDETTAPFYVNTTGLPAGPYLGKLNIDYWPDLLQPYAKSGQGQDTTSAGARGIFGCPSTNFLVAPTNEDSRHIRSVRYAYNQSNINNDYIVFDTGSQSKGIKLSKLGNSAETVLFAEGFLGSGPFLGGSLDSGDPAADTATQASLLSAAYPGGYAPDKAVTRANNPTDGNQLVDSLENGNKDENGATVSNMTTDRTLRGHFDGSNYAFTDGHVKWMKGTKMRNWVANP